VKELSLDRQAGWLQIPSWNKWDVDNAGFLTRRDNEDIIRRPIEQVQAHALHVGYTNSIAVTDLTGKEVTFHTHGIDPATSALVKSHFTVTVRQARRHISCKGFVKIAVGEWIAFKLIASKKTNATKDKQVNMKVVNPVIIIRSSSEEALAGLLEKEKQKQ
jgi:hypothetical protein